MIFFTKAVGLRRVIDFFDLAMRDSFPRMLLQSTQLHEGPHMISLAKQSQYSLRHLDRLQLHVTPEL